MSKGKNKINSTNSSTAHKLRYDDHLIKELAFDLGVDTSVLKQQLHTLFSAKVI